MRPVVLNLNEIGNEIEDTIAERVGLISKARVLIHMAWLSGQIGNEVWYQIEEAGQW